MRLNCSINRNMMLRMVSFFAFCGDGGVFQVREVELGVVLLHIRNCKVAGLQRGGFIKGGEGARSHGMGVDDDRAFVLRDIIEKSMINLLLLDDETRT